jgi:hypothetical protein
MVQYKVVIYTRIDFDEDQVTLFHEYREAEAERRHAAFLQPENIYLIEAVYDQEETREATSAREEENPIG